MQIYRLGKEPMQCNIVHFAFECYGAGRRRLLDVTVKLRTDIVTTSTLPH